MSMLLGAVSSAITDVYFNLVTLLLPGNGTNGAQNNTFLDSSTNNFTITRNGNTTQGTFSPFSQTRWSFYGGSASNNNVGIYLNGESDFAFGTGDFTIEMWVNLASKSPGQIIYDSRPDGTQGLYPTIFVDGSTNKLKFFVNNTDRITQNSTFTYNAWHHVVVTRTGTNTKMFVNGIQEGSTYTDSNNYINGALRPFTGDGVTPTPPSNSYGITGYISNLRVVKGSGPYQSAGSSITVPTSPLTPVTNTVLLTAQSNRFVDTNTQVSAKTINTFNSPTIQAFSPFAPTAAYSAATVGGSGYFDGTGDYLTIPSNTAFEFGSGDFTMEFSIYGTTSVTSKTFLQYGQAAVTGWTQISWGFGTDASNFPFLEVSNGVNNPQFTITSNTALRLNEWNHLAVVRSGTDFRIYLNGVSVASTTSSFSLFAPGGTVFFWIARAHDNATPRDTSGYISNLRVVKGAAVYTGAFTPPRAPLATSGAASASAYSSTTNVNTSFAASATSLLCNFTNAGVVDSTGDNVLETVGNAQISTAQSKFGGSSMYFDGTGDYLISSESNICNFGLGDFTIEFWLYLNTTSGTQNIIDPRPASTTGAYATLYTSGGTIRFSTQTTDRITSSSVNTNEWFHVAVCRSGTSTKMFFNGTQTGSTYTDTNSYVSSRLVIGAGFANTSSITNAMNGYIDDLRISRYARYTANFTAPTAAFPLQ
jgi:hypothetical protein